MDDTLLTQRMGNWTASRMYELVQALAEPNLYEVEARDKGKFAVVKPGAKKAIKICDSACEAQQIAAERNDVPPPRYVLDNLAERLCRLSVDAGNRGSADTQRGHEREPYALYELTKRTGQVVDPGEWMPHPTIPNAGATPDGFIGTAGLAEGKAPKPAIHLQRLLTGKVDPEYWYQCQWQLDCAPDREYVRFISYCPEAADTIAGDISFWVRDVFRDERAISRCRTAVKRAEVTLLECIEKLARVSMEGEAA